MIEQYIERTCGDLVERLAGRDRIALNELRTLLPPDALAWCKADAMEHLMFEWAEQGATSRILAATPESPRVVRAAMSSLVPFFVYERADAVAVVRQAMVFASQYVVRPRAVLMSQVFRGGTSVSGEVLQVRLSAVVEYSYLPTLLVRKLGLLEEVPWDQFEASVASIDDAAVRQHDPEEFARLMSPIVRWSALAGGDPRCVPVPALLEFLDDKRLLVLRDYVASIARIRSRTEMDVQEIATLVRDIEVNDVTHLRGLAASRVQEPVEPIPPPPEVQYLEPEPAPPVAPDLSEPPAEQPVEPPAPFAELPEPVLATPTADSSVPEASPMEAQLEQHASTALPPRTFPPDMRSSLSNSLFHGNVAYFDVTVTEISRLETWRDAATYLTDLLEINRLNPYAADVMQFTDAIRKWFVRDDEESPA